MAHLLSTKTILVRAFVMLGIMLIILYTCELWDAMDAVRNETRIVSVKLMPNVSSANVSSASYGEEYIEKEGDYLETSKDAGIEIITKSDDDNLKTTAGTNKNNKIVHGTKPSHEKEKSKNSKEKKKENNIQETSSEKNLKKTNSEKNIEKNNSDLAAGEKSSSKSSHPKRVFKHKKKKFDPNAGAVEGKLKNTPKVPINIGPPLIPYKDGKSLNETEEEFIANPGKNTTAVATYGLPKCSCKRTLAATTEHGLLILKGRSGERVLPRRSTCSDAASARGDKQRVISFSFYGNPDDPYIQRRYFTQIAERVQEMEEVYPDFTMRVYHNLLPSNPDWSILCGLYCQHQKLDFCDVRKLPKPWGNIVSLNGRLWRFIAMMDPLVDVALSRDVDSWLIPREEKAVREWITKDVPCHLMRDHPNHGLVLAGCWDARLDLDRASFYESVGTMMSQPLAKLKRFNGADQFLMVKFWWPIHKDNMIIHDSYKCDNDEFHGAYTPLPYPSKRTGVLYVGRGPARVAPHTVNEICPVICRPIEHQDWTYC